jgi:hypothetical protein
VEIDPLYVDVIIRRFEAETVQTGGGPEQELPDAPTVEAIQPGETTNS